VSYEVVHEAIHENERLNMNQHRTGLLEIPETAGTIRYPHGVDNIANHTQHVSSPTTAANLNGVVVADVWSSNWNEMNDDDSITSAGTVLRRSFRPPQHEIVLVRSKYSYAQESVSRLNGCTVSSCRTTYPGKSVSDGGNNVQYGFPWEAYLEAISSGVATKSKKKVKKSASQYLPKYFDRAAYTLVEL
jgi:hypothetical protein